VNDIYDSSQETNRNIGLKLDFFAARIAAFHGSPDLAHIRRALNDARVSCLLLLRSSGQQTPAMSEWLESLLLSMHSLKFLKEPLRRNTGKKTNKRNTDQQFLKRVMRSLLNQSNINSKACSTRFLSPRSS
jgi:hypothetical protein